MRRRALRGIDTNYGKTTVVLCTDEHDLGRRAAADVAARTRSLLKHRDGISIIFAAGESQMTFLDAPTTDLPASILLQVGGTLYVDRHSCPPGLPS